jgi:hypothetical protein
MYTIFEYYQTAREAVSVPTSEASLALTMEMKMKKTSKELGEILAAKESSDSL